MKFINCCVKDKWIYICIVYIWKRGNLMKTQKYTENKYDIIRCVLRNYASREKPISPNQIKVEAEKWDIKSGELLLQDL